MLGICVLFGVLLITEFKHNLDMQKKGQPQPLYSAIKLGLNSKIRPEIMIALMAAIGLLPTPISHGVGSENSRPLAKVVIGGIICAMFVFSILIFPIFLQWPIKSLIQSVQKLIKLHRQKNRPLNSAFNFLHEINHRIYISGNSCTNDKC